MVQFNFYNIYGEEYRCEGWFSDTLVDLRVRPLGKRWNDLLLTAFLVLLIVLTWLFYSKASYFAVCLSLLCLILYTLYLSSRCTEEQVLLVHGFGLQLASTFWLGQTERELIHREEIVGLGINEVLTQNRVLFMLQVKKTNNESSQTIVPLFQHSMPRLDSIMRLYDYLGDPLKGGQTPLERDVR